jgi:hypothetical protein
LPEFPSSLQANITSGADILEVRPGTWRLQIPAGQLSRYRLAQLDDYHGLGRGAFLWQPPLRLSLRARACAEMIPGTTHSAWAY